MSKLQFYLWGLGQLAVLPPPPKKIIAIFTPPTCVLRESEGTWIQSRTSSGLTTVG
ncbi:hypothetical protein HanIR_Chr05g0234021 [Helianthus annuus]|nr:hypothetical protein HanIR_Chr05g0234021 [Helianthus annuus]